MYEQQEKKQVKKAALCRRSLKKRKCLIKNDELVF